jgi:Ca-activated chloride channel family protein
VSFARPLLLVLVALVPLWLWLRRRRRLATVRVADGALPLRAVRASWPVRVPPALRAVACTALLIAAAGPRFAGDRTMLKREGIAIVVAIDVSSSMLAEDFAPSNRLEVA